MSWANVCDLGYSIVGLVIVGVIWVRVDPAVALLIGGLMILCYLAGSVKYRAH